VKHLCSRKHTRCQLIARERTEESRERVTESAWGKSRREAPRRQIWPKRGSWKFPNVFVLFFRRLWVFFRLSHFHVDLFIGFFLLLRWFFIYIYTNSGFCFPDVFCSFAFFDQCCTTSFFDRRPGFFFFSWLLLATLPFLLICPFSIFVTSFPRLHERECQSDIAGRSSTRSLKKK